MRFGIEVASAIREAVGAGFPVLFRMTGAELMPESRPLEEVEAFAAALVGGGRRRAEHRRRVARIAGADGAGGGAGGGVRAVGGAAIKARRRRSVPVIAGNRVNRLRGRGGDPRGGERRPGLDVAAVPRRSPDRREGPDGPRRSTSASPATRPASTARSSAGTCRAWSTRASGYEVDFPRPTTARTRRGPAFAVIGGGPGGAGGRAGARRRSAARSDLYEAREELGGQFRWARLVPGKEDYGATISYFESELERLGVHLHLGHELGEDDADAHRRLRRRRPRHRRPPPRRRHPRLRPPPRRRLRRPPSSRASATRDPSRSSAPAASASTSRTSSPTRRATSPISTSRYGRRSRLWSLKSRIERPSLHSKGLSDGAR